MKTYSSSQNFLLACCPPTEGRPLKKGVIDISKKRYLVVIIIFSMRIEGIQESFSSEITDKARQPVENLEGSTIKSNSK